MPDLDDPALARKTTKPAAPSRRSVLRVAAGAGAAGIAATTLGSLVGGVAAHASTASRTPAGHAGPEDPAGTDALVLHVRDAAAGEIDLFRGTTQTRLHDRDLAARIVRAGR